MNIYHTLTWICFLLVILLAGTHPFFVGDTCNLPPFGRFFGWIFFRTGKSRYTRHPFIPETVEESKIAVAWIEVCILCVFLVVVVVGGGGEVAVVGMS